MSALKGLKVLELAAIGPAPFCGMMLADFGADVVRIERPVAKRGLTTELGRDVLNRGKRSIAIDLKHPEGVAIALELVAKADIIIEGHRPGVMERLGLGPDVCLALNPRLVYGRITGFGQDGPLAQRAGHDINYIALSGVLGMLGTPERPAIPANLVGDFGGGGMMLAFGVLAAAFHAQRTGMGQVVDAAMIDGSAVLMTAVMAMRAAGLWNDTRATNLLDGGAPFYNVYTTQDGKHVAVGPIEPQFRAIFLERLGLSPDINMLDPDEWPAQRAQLEVVFATKTRAEWESIFTDTDACVFPVLSIAEAPSYPHNAARKTFVEVDGVAQPAPAPKLTKTPATLNAAPPNVGQDTRAILRELGRDADDLVKRGIVLA
ncbi:MAG: CaiB/BaiF CoA transferase family protein [Myxococcota bacterium]